MLTNAGVFPNFRRPFYLGSEDGISKLENAGIYCRLRACACE